MRQPGSHAKWARALKQTTTSRGIPLVRSTRPVTTTPRMWLAVQKRPAPARRRFGADVGSTGGLERELLAADPACPMHIKRDAQRRVLEGASLLPSAAGQRRERGPDEFIRW